jgi:hypothetical protein
MGRSEIPAGPLSTPSRRATDHEGYQPTVACAAGSMFAMTEPFPFSVDPGELLAD